MDSDINMNRHYNVHTYIHIFTYAHEYSIFTYICEYICAVDVYESSVLYIQRYKVSVWQITSRTYELTYVRMPVELLCTYVCTEIHPQPSSSSNAGTK